jgi:hypothetical protein
MDILIFINLIYYGALHLYHQLHTFIYKYYGATHLIGFSNAAELQNICRYTTNIMVLRTFLVFQMQQSCKIFVDIHLKNRTIGAEHRNILFL